MITIMLQQIDEQVTVKLDRIPQNDTTETRTQRKLTSHISRLENQVHELQQRMAEFGTRGLQPLAGDARISEEQLMTFAREFRDDYKVFREAYKKKTRTHGSHSLQFVAIVSRAIAMARPHRISRESAQLEHAFARLASLWHKSRQ